jgi:hypothetical protein
LIDLNPERDLHKIATINKMAKQSKTIIRDWREMLNIDAWHGCFSSSGNQKQHSAITPLR